MRSRSLTSALLTSSLSLAAGLAACGVTDENAAPCSSYACSGQSTPDGGSTPAPDPDAATQTTAEARRSRAKELFLGLYPDFANSDTCGRCHASGQFDGAPLFLGGANGEAAYTTITDREAYPNIVVLDFANSILLTKGVHAGAALLESYPSFAEKIVVWLRWEAAALDAVVAPTTEPFTITVGTNSLPLDALGGPPGASLKFEASVVSGFLRLQDTRISVAGDKAIHLAAPRLYAVKADGTDLLDPSDSFGSVDVTAAPGATTALAPAGAIFAGDGWTPWDPTTRIRVEARTIEETEIQDGGAGGGPTECKDVARFTAEVKPILMGQNEGAGVRNGSCRAANCHGNAQKSPDMSTQFTDAELCKQIRLYLDFENPAESRIIERPVSAGHAGGNPSNINAYSQFWQTKINDGGIF